MPITKPPKVIKHIIHKEVQEGVGEISVDYGNSEAINDDIDLAFTVYDKQINSKKLIENIASNCRILPYIKDNTLFLKGINPSPDVSLKDDGGDVDMYIESLDIISYINKRTAPEKVYTKVIVNYHYDYALKEYMKNTVENNSEPDNAAEWFMYNDQGGGTGEYSIDKEQELPFNADYIREATPAQALQEFLLLWYCNQHNILKLKLPLKYIQLKIGDYIGFDKIINGVKLFGEDYSVETFLNAGYVFRNGQQILPIWMITSTDKTLTHIDVEMIQMHNCSKDLISFQNQPVIASDGFYLQLVSPVTDFYVLGSSIVITSEVEWFSGMMTVNASDAENDELRYRFFIVDSLDGFHNLFIGIDFAPDAFYRMYLYEDLKLQFDLGNNPEYHHYDWHYPYDVNLTGFSLGGVHSPENNWLSSWANDESIPDGGYLQFPAGMIQAVAYDGNQPSNVSPMPGFRVYKNSFPDWQSGTVTIDYFAGWNLVSAPMWADTGSNEYDEIFPEAIPGTLFAFDTTYQQSTVMQPGVGYWLRFEEDGSTTFSGTYNIYHERILPEGWSLIGGLGVSDIDFWGTVVDISDVLIPNTLFGFAGVYQGADNLVPGKGYWVRTSNSGIISMNIDF